MTHPKLPEQQIWVRPNAVAAYQHSGWQVADEPEPETTQAEPEPEPKAKSRRRTAEPAPEHGADGA